MNQVRATGSSHRGITWQAGNMCERNVLFVNGWECSGGKVTIPQWAGVLGQLSQVPTDGEQGFLLVLSSLTAPRETAPLLLYVQRLMLMLMWLFTVKQGSFIIIIITFELYSLGIHLSIGYILSNLRLKREKCVVRCWCVWMNEKGALGLFVHVLVITTGRGSKRWHSCD